jgi:LuxR family transcriptional regulator, maltose regulon positive regulatory protein
LGAIKEIREVLSDLERIESHLTGAECHLALGLLCHDQGQEEQARAHLQKGFLIARQRDYRHFIIISPRDFLRVCTLAQEYLEAGSSAGDYAARLLVSKFGRQAEAELEKLSRHPHPQVSQKALELRRSIHRAATPLLRIQTFGGLRLYFNTQPMEDEAWGRLQPRKLLVAILSQENEKVHKEVLIEALWPEEHPATGEKNFKTTLQRLRKSLEPDLNPAFGSAYIHLHHNQIFLDETFCRIDSRKFMALFKEGEAREKGGDGPGALDCFIRALDLYQGDFIPEERYAPGVEQRREDLKQIYIDLLTRTARYHEQAGAFKKAATCLKQVIEADPLLEEAYCGLMSLYAGKGQFNEALRVYETCQKALQTGLDSKPDPVTVALYRGIKERQQKS